MAIITEYKKVKQIYDEAAKKGWVIPCLCSENLTTSEAIIAAASEFAKENGYDSVPVTLAITVQYDHRSQSRYYTHTRRWDIGLKLFRQDAEILSEAYPNVDLLIHLDHVQHDLDEELLTWDLSGFSSMMYDASTLPFEENIKKTAAFVKKMKDKILIEGACDEIFDATGLAHNSLTTPENAERYVKETGVDLIVANLGTEHRASGQQLHYYGDIANEIKEKVGHTIVLHGTSSVSNDQIKNLYNDGICKVNIWTALERDASPDLAEFIVKNISKVAGTATVEKLIQEGYLTEKCNNGEKPALTHFTTAARQDVVYNKMKAIVREYIDMWYR